MTKTNVNIRLIEFCSICVFRIAILAWRRPLAPRAGGAQDNQPAKQLEAFGLMLTILNLANDILVWNVTFSPKNNSGTVQKHQVVTAAKLHTSCKHAQHLDA
jgi:hypothetical protein